MAQVILLQYVIHEAVILHVKHSGTEIRLIECFLTWVQCILDFRPLRICCEGGEEVGLVHVSHTTVMEFRKHSL